jgi:stringent starvation protein B
MSGNSDTSTKPYLIRAIHEWCSDNGYTPYLAVAIDSRCVVPRDYVKAGEIVLNVSISATNALSMGNEFIEFQARFGGVARDISVPIECVSAVYARENGHGMAFDVPKPLALTPEEAAMQTIKAVTSKKPALKAVPERAADAENSAPSEASNLAPASLVDVSAPSKSLKDVAKIEADSTTDAPEPTPPPTNGGPPKLKRVK